jgi:glyoxylate/hydroxypyruvate reductase
MSSAPAVRGAQLRVVITTPLEPDLVRALQRFDETYEVVYPEDLIATPRYPGDHRFPPADSPALMAAWRELLAGADILFDFGPQGLHSELAGMSNIRWIQATSAGVGQMAQRLGLTARSDLIITTASGVHGPALAEFVVLAMIFFNRDFADVLRDQHDHVWQRTAGRLVAGQTVGVVGLGSIGGAVVQAVSAFGARTIGVVRDLAGRTAAGSGVGRLVAGSELNQILPELDVLVLAVPHTAETEGLLSAERIAQLGPSCLVVNIARGSVVDEPALVLALQEGRIRGAALDVFAQEPLPTESPLWDLPNVLVSPHSASTVEDENRKIAELFGRNLNRYRDHEPMLNVLDPRLLY